MILLCKAVALVLLDLSAAFDKVHHDVLLLSIEKQMFCLPGKVREWFGSYLKECCQRVSVQGALSNVLSLFCGVPQGSIIGPLIFTVISCYNCQAVYS